MVVQRIYCWNGLTSATISGHKCSFNLLTLSYLTFHLQQLIEIVHSFNCDSTKCAVSSKISYSFHHIQLSCSVKAYCYMLFHFQVKNILQQDNIFCCSSPFEFQSLYLGALARPKLLKLFLAKQTCSQTVFVR